MENKGKLILIVRVNKCRIWAGHVARVEEIRSAFKILTGTPTGNENLEVLGVDGKKILECILWKCISIY